ncbi:MAG: iron chelate uptake ABC transporter family permease subunit [Patulibacter sp.]|nr:iron chelate uptake ABC transporter family permease subunit [Patulibacter sp.]
MTTASKRVAAGDASTGRDATDPGPTGSRTGPRWSTRAAVLVGLAALLVACVALSLAIGARTIALADVWNAVVHHAPTRDGQIVRELRAPRTWLGIEVGVALGVAGTLMQAMTRNPLADPGLLGVNAGAATAVVTGIVVFGIGSFGGYVWLAFAGAAAALLLVHALGGRGGSASPVRLALAGTAISATLTAIVGGMVLLDPGAFETFRAWEVGSLTARGPSVAGPVAVFVIVGGFAALALARPLNALALGDDTGRALGAHVGRTRAAAFAAIALLSGAATAAAGPIGFLGLTVPHMARALMGPDHRWVLPCAALLGPCLLLAADVLGRVVDRPGEIQVGVVAAILGAPVFIALVRRRRIAAL